MKPKDKAEQLIYAYSTAVLIDIYDAKLCALIAVDEIISSNPHSNPLNTNVESTMEWWQEVKQEIELL